MENMIYPREKYLSKIRPFYDSDVVKVITGIRRSGKIVTPTQLESLMAIMPISKSHIR